MGRGQEDFEVYLVISKVMFPAYRCASGDNRIEIPTILLEPIFLWVVLGKLPRLSDSYTAFFLGQLTRLQILLCPYHDTAGRSNRESSH
jgi:hypothetical protein